MNESLTRVREWVEQRNYLGYDPADGLTSPLRRLTFGNLFAERLLQQFIWKSPWNVRPWVGIRPMESTKGRGFMAWGYLMLRRATGEDQWLDRARACLEWLKAHRTPNVTGFAWGNHFDFSTRAGRIPAGQPTIVWSGLIGQAFLEAYEQAGDESFLEAAMGICDWILEAPRRQTDAGTCLSYVQYTGSWIHNSNMLGAGMLARTWMHCRREKYLAVAREAMLYSCSRQRPDGSWWYGEDPKYHWIDNFHTGYNLDCLKRYQECSGDASFDTHLWKGLEYYKKRFFLEDGAPKYYHDRTYPIDIQCAGQAIDSLALFSTEDPECLELAKKVAKWTIERMQEPDGHFAFRIYPMVKARVAYFHWGQGTMFKALAHLLWRMKEPTPAAVANEPAAESLT